MRQSAEDLATKVGVSRACLTLSVPRSSLYRDRMSGQKPQKNQPNGMLLRNVTESQLNLETSKI